MRRAIGTCAAALLLAAGAAGGPEEAPAAPRAPEVFLTWNAPHGQPRAADFKNLVCGDSSRRDTLYLTFDPGRDSSRLVAVDAEIRLWPSGGDTLDRHWWFESRTNPAHLLADFNTAAPGAEAIWTASGMGGIRTVSGPDTAFIRMVWAVRGADAATVYGGRRYAFARLVVPRPLDPAVCARPLCFEVQYARLAHDVSDNPIVRQGRRWASWNPGSGTPCAERVRQSRVTPWRGPTHGR